MLKTLISKSTKAPAKKMPHVNNLTLKTFIKNYNEKYSQSISENQQELLNKYILSFSDNGLEFKLYLNEEVARLKSELHTILENKELTTDKGLKEKLTELRTLLESFSRTRIDEKMIVKIMKIQNLIKETKE